MIHAQDMYITADGDLKAAGQLTEEQAELVRRFRNLEYYRVHHFPS